MPLTCLYYKHPLKFVKIKIRITWVLIRIPFKQKASCRHKILSAEEKKSKLVKILRGKGIYFQSGSLPRWKACDTEVFRYGSIPTRKYSETEVFRHGSIPTRKYFDTEEFRHGSIPTRKYSDLLIFRLGSAPSESIFRRNQYDPKKCWSYVFGWIFCLSNSENFPHL